MRNERILELAPTTSTCRQCKRSRWMCSLLDFLYQGITTKWLPSNRQRDTAGRAGADAGRAPHYQPTLMMA